MDLSENKLTDSSLDVLIQNKSNFSALKVLSLGGRTKKKNNGNNLSTSVNSSNQFSTEKLAALPEAFPDFINMDLTTLRITSLQSFSGVKDSLAIDFEGNKISDFAGFESRSNFSFGFQQISLSGNYAAGRQGELPELVKRVLDPNDPLYASNGVAGTNCSVSADGTKLVIDENVRDASLKVKNGKLDSSTITIELKKVPNYTVPQDLTANVGDTLASVSLPSGFAWQDSSLNVGQTAGAKTFKADYTPDDTDAYIIDYGIEVPVTVIEPGKELPAYTVPTGLTANEGDTLASISLPKGFAWKDSAQSVGTAGEHTFKAVYTPDDTDKYSTVDDIDIQVTVNAKPQKQTPSFTIPTGLTANEGDTLASVSLPSGFAWQNAAQAVGAAGEHTFMAVYTPADAENYAVVENIPVSVTVKAKEANAEPATTPEEEDDDDTEEPSEVTIVAPAKTSDASPILPAVILLVCGVAVCGTVTGVMIYKKKKTM